MKKISVSDFTISALGSCKFRKKTETAKLLDTVGVCVIELGRLCDKKKDAVVFKTIASIVKNCSVAASADSIEEIEAVFGCIKDAVKPRIIISLPVSTVQMEYFYHMKAPKMLSYVETLCKEAAKLSCDVEFEALDATRADRELLNSIASSAKEWGVSALTLSDCEGVVLPDEFSTIVKDIVPICGCKVGVKTSNALSMGAYTAISAISAGADFVKVSAVGESNLSPNTFSDVIRAKGEALGISTDIDERIIHSTVSAVLSENGAVQETVISEGETVTLDKTSSATSVAHAVESLGYDLSAEDMSHVYEEFSKVAEKKETVGERELEAIVAAVAMQVPSAYHLVSYTISCGNLISALAHIVLECDGEQISGTGTGDGPIDAAFSAIEQTVGHHYELDDFQIHAVTKGHAAVGSTLVKLRHDGHLYAGVGVSTDIVGAGIRAYINALNKIVYEGK